MDVGDAFFCDAALYLVNFVFTLVSYEFLDVCWN